jgi:hypothetical protein
MWGEAKKNLACVELQTETISKHVVCAGLVASIVYVLRALALEKVIARSQQGVARYVWGRPHEVTHADVEGF